MRHWAFDLVGKPWGFNERGPKAYSCWGLIWHAFATQQGITLPWVPEKPERDAEIIRDAAHASGWRPAGGPLQEWDVVSMRQLARRHVGLGVKANGAVLVLHAEGALTAAGPTGSIRLEPIEQLKTFYKELELWRKI